MKSPKLDDGYTRIANPIIEALAGIRISGEEVQCLWVILRKTYGWGKSEDAISLGQFEMLTNIKKPNIKRALNNLLSKKIIVINIDNVSIRKYSINKDLEEWKPLSKKITVKKALSKKITGVINNDNRLSISRIKETLTKEKRNYCRLAELWNKTITENIPVIRRPNKLSNSRKKAIKKAWEDYDNYDDWEQIFKALTDSRHHQGYNPSKWVAGFDWIMKPVNYPRFYDLARAKKPPDNDEILAAQSKVGAHEPKERTPEEKELSILRSHRAWAKRGEVDALTPQQTERLEALEGGLANG
jgi:phage replication O-like protein O